MQRNAKSLGIDRRKFLATTSGSLLAATISRSAKAAVPAGGAPESFDSSTRAPQTASGSLRKIPIGLFDPVYDDLSLDELLERVSALGL